MEPTSKPRVKARYTTVDGRRMQSYSDGTSEQISLPTAEQKAQMNPTAASTSTPTVPTAPPTPTIGAGIPASMATDQTPGVALPPVQQPPDTANEAKSFGEQYLGDLQSEAQARLAQAQAPVTQGEQNIRSLMGIANTESATREQLEKSRGVTGLEEQMRRTEQSIAQQIAAIDDFDDSTAFNTEEMRIDASKRDVTKGTFGAQSAEYNLQRALSRRGQAAQLRATVAANAALQGNLDLATEQVDKALKSIYDPIKQDLAMEQFFLQRNDKRFDAAQKEVSDLRLKQIDRQFAEIDRANAVVDAAVASGGASGEEIQKMVSLSGDPTEQRNYAISILARTNSSDRALERELKNIQMENIRSEIDNRGTAEKPLTQAQLTALGFGERVMQANQVISEVGSKFTGGLSTITGAGWFPNMLKSEERQQYEQAQRNYINAVLRRESGASIAPTEFDSARLQYFPQPGDSTGVLAQKAVNRAMVEKSILREGGQDTSIQDKTINDPLGLGIQTTNVNNPLGI